MGTKPSVERGFFVKGFFVRFSMTYGIVIKSIVIVVSSSGIV